MRRCLSWMRFARSPTVILSLSAGAFFAHTTRAPVWLDGSKSDAKWPGTKAVVSNRNTKKDEEGQIILKKASTGNHSGIGPVPSTEENDVPLLEDDESAAWALFSSRVQLAASALSVVKWPALGDTITDFLFPTWAKLLPDYVTKFQRELDMAEGSLADEIWREAQDPEINPEIAYVATVRIGKDLCQAEKEFRQRRRRYTSRALARYLDIPEDEVDPEDVPTIALCGSGGGLRAMVAGCGSYLSAKEAGLFDCVTYTAGVSGSCWLQALYYSSIGKQNYQRIIDHLKYRIGTHIAFPPAALELLTTAPTNKFLLSGFVEKLKGDPRADVGLVDIYGILLAARLLVPRHDLEVDNTDLKLSNQRAHLVSGKQPLPIYTAVRHEIPLEEVASKEGPLSAADMEATKEKAKRESWFQWFEFTPYEFFCEELEAGIPSWGLGRRYQNGRSVPHERNLHLPEYRLPLLLGIWGSAFCATLAHYYQEIRPLVQGFTGFIGLDGLIEGRNDDLTKVHPIDPASIPNFVLGLRDQLPPTCPESIFQSDHLQLADAGMSNNLPLYPLLREGRDVDILIAFDSSADIRAGNWLSVADGYAKQRGVKGWPIGAGWPREAATEQQTVMELDNAEAKSPQEAADKVADASAQQRQSQSQSQTENSPEESSTNNSNNNTPITSQPKQPNATNPPDLTYCNVWVGTTLERTSSTEPPPSKLLSPDPDSDQWELLSPNAGITVIYFPLLPNPAVDDKLDPNTTDYLSTWNFVYAPADIDRVVSLARANFKAGQEQTRRTVRAVYERKKRNRIQREEKERIGRWEREWKVHGDPFR